MRKSLTERKVGAQRAQQLGKCVCKLFAGAMSFVCLADFRFQFQCRRAQPQQQHCWQQQAETVHQLDL